MFLTKKLESSSINLKYRIKSQAKYTSKQNIIQPTPENKRKKAFSLFQNLKNATNKKSVNYGRKGLAGLKPMDFKGCGYIKQNNGLVIMTLPYTQNKISLNKKGSCLKLNFVDDSRKSFTTTTQKESLAQIVNEKIISLQRLKQIKSGRGEGQLEDKNGISKLFSMTNTFSENEINQMNQSEERLQMQLQVSKQSIAMKIQLVNKNSSKHKIQSKTVDLFLSINSTQLVHKYQQLNHELQNLEQKYTKLKYRISQLNEANKQTNYQFINKAKFLAEFQQKYKNEVEKLQRIKEELEIKTIQLETIIKKGKEIQNYVVTQSKRKLLHQVSEDYKKKEGDMYDYALQMQTSTWATGLKEVKPFAQQEKYLFERMSALQRELGNHENKISFEMKCNQIKDFVSKMYASFKRMNDDMRAVNDFKTKCIRQFVLRMQSWLQNWQLKQQFLMNLRQDFALQQMRIGKILVELQKILQAKGMMISSQRKYIELKISLEKLKENYKLGNSFY